MSKEQRLAQSCEPKQEVVYEWVTAFDSQGHPRRVLMRRLRWTWRSLGPIQEKLVLRVDVDE